MSTHDDFVFTTLIANHPDPAAASRALQLAEAAVLRRAADAISALPQDYECDPGRGDAAERLRRTAAGIEEKCSPGEAEAAPGLTVYRASHESIPFGLYTTAEAAREHCETYERRDQPTAELDWIEDDEDGIAELVAAVGEEERSTGYVVTALAVASKYDEEADE